jgi:hypothetical protein
VFNFLLRAYHPVAARTATGRDEMLRYEIA